MCYELFKDGVLVYSDCQYDDTPTQNTSYGNTTFAHNSFLTNSTNSTNTTRLRQGTLLPPNATTNVSVLPDVNSSFNLSSNCWATPSPCVCNESAFGAMNDSVVDANDTIQNATTATVVHSNTSAHAPASHEWWIVVLLCLCLFALCVLRAYSLRLRKRLAFMRGKSVAPDTRLKDVVPTAFPEEPPQTPSSSASVGLNTTSTAKSVIAKSKKKNHTAKHSSYKVGTAEN